MCCFLGLTDQDFAELASGLLCCFCYGPDQDVVELIWLDSVLFIEVHCSKLSFSLLSDCFHHCFSLSGTRIQTLFPLTHRFLPVVFLFSGHCFLSLHQLNIIIANHFPPAAYIMYYLLQMGFFLGRRSWLRWRKITQGRMATKKLNTDPFGLQCVGKIYLLRCLPQNICDSHENGIRSALWWKCFP